MTSTDGVPPEIAATAGSAGLGEVISSWPARPQKSPDDAVFVCAGGVVLGAGPGAEAVSGGWGEISSFRWAKQVHHDRDIGHVNTWTSFAVRFGLPGGTVSAGFRSATVTTPERDFFTDGADQPDLPDEWALYRAEDEITAAWLPRFRARLEAGPEVDFGAMALSPAGVRVRGETFPWPRVAGAEYKTLTPAPGEKVADPGTRLSLYVREPGHSDDDEMAWPEVVIPSLEIDYQDALIKLINEQPTSFGADEPA